MKRIIWILLGLSFYGSGSLRAQTASFNFSLASHAVTGWVNISGDPSVAVRTGTDAASGISISSVGTANWVPYSSAAAYDGGGVSNGTFFPSGVMVNHWYQYSGTLANYNAAVPQLQISGLNKDSVYTISMTSSNIYSLISNPTQYTVAGLTVLPNQNLNTANNVASGVSFVNVSPDATGKIKVYVNTISTTQLADISGIQIVRGHITVNTPVVAITSPANNDSVAEASSIALNATASESGGTIVKVEFFDGLTSLGQSLGAPYSVVWADPVDGRHTITAKATDNVGTTSSASIILNVESFGGFWSTTGNIATGGDTNFIGTVDSNRLAIRTKNIERVSVLPTGNVGIGTKTPSAQLHTTGSVRLAGITNDSTKTRVLVSDTSGNLYYRSASSLTGRWLNVGTTVYDSADNIAIGTSNPQGYKLAVNGTAIFTKVKIKTAGTWPDYVFKKDYRLPDLMELEKYITLHQHLPGILSESEVQLDGIDVGDHQAALLKKIEELTLYLIEENKKLKEQHQQLAEQNARLEHQQQEIDALKELIRSKK